MGSYDVMTLENDRERVDQLDTWFSISLACWNFAWVLSQKLYP